MTSKEAENHFLYYLNNKLTKKHAEIKKLSTKKDKRDYSKFIETDFVDHIENCSSKNKDKITKRYITLFSELKSQLLLKYTKKLFNENPGLRDKVLNYYEKIPFNKISAKQLLKILDSIEWLDEVTLFKIIECATRWHVPYDERGKWFALEIEKRLSKHTTPFGWFCWIHFLAKYGEPHQILTGIAASKKFGAKEPFYARQGMASLPRSLGLNQKKVLQLWHDEISTGVNDSASVANHLIQAWEGGFPAKNHRMYFYLFPQKAQNPYPISKFLILCALAAAETSKGLKIKRPIVCEHVKDPWYLHWLKGLNNEWF